MRKLTLALIVLPGSALAHGGHAPVPDVVHGITHGGFYAGVVLLALAIGVAWMRRDRE